MGEFGTPRGANKHAGIDINAPKGTAVLAPADGKIINIINRNMSNDPGEIRASKGQGAGTVVDIDHGKGVVTRYFHLEYKSARFAVGETVNAGDVIATVGRTGNTPAKGDTHLHFEIRLNGKPVDPSKYIPIKQ